MLHSVRRPGEAPTNNSAIPPPPFCVYRIAFLSNYQVGFILIGAAEDVNNDHRMAKSIENSIDS